MNFCINDLVLTPFGVGIVMGTLTKDGDVEVLVSEESQIEERHPRVLYAYDPEQLTRLVPEAR